MTAAHRRRKRGAGTKISVTLSRLAYKRAARAAVKAGDEARVEEKAAAKAEEVVMKEESEA